MTKFVHLHVHSHFSMLDGMSKVPDLIKKCKKNGMYSMALTDHGNMYGIKEFVDAAAKENGKVKDAIKEQNAILANEEATAEEKAAAEAKIEELKGQHFKPIIGTEAYCSREGHLTRVIGDRGWHLILLAKNKQGYKSLCKLASIAFTEGNYYHPRIDHELLEKYHEGLIVCSACLGGEIPQKIMAGDIEGAEQSVVWFKNLFGEDFYLELQRHKTDKPNAAYDTYEKQEPVNQELIRMARKYGVKLVATNDVHFVEEAHGEAHDRLICLATAKDFDDPDRMHYTKQEWLKSPEEMEAIFGDIPEALTNTLEIVDKVEEYSIDSDPLMPMFDIPESFGSEAEYRSRITEKELFDEFTQNEKHEVVMDEEAANKKIKKLGGYDKLYRIKFEADYLEQLVWAGAHKRYGEELTDEQTERIVFELHTIKTMGFPGYFLIVSDYIRAAREELGVSVGPGRGSAAGSVVAYCLWITDVDPLKYDLLFERFLNPDRISLPDIDVDFDDEGRGKVLDWVTKKYGAEKVAHIITYGTMATKSSIADVGRVQKLPLSKVAELKGYIPEKSFPDDLRDENGQKFEKLPKVNLDNCLKYVPQLKDIMNSEQEEVKSVLTYASQLENTNRQVGIHACGVIIGAMDLTDVAPVCTIKDKETKEDVLVTQYDGHVVETVGLIKMDFLGLKTLSIIKDALRNIKQSRGEDVDIDHIPIDDEETYKLYSEGATIGTFQFESPGMQKYLRELQPSKFEDIIAMNALYRPGPMDYIPDFIDRKLGRKPIQYDIPEMELYLKDTYGITVYQEQVMLLSRQLANFTRGESDTLRKAMGKKQIAKMNELEGFFMERGQKNGHDPKVLNKIWEDWKKFASYAFNKSHATCYSWVAYQTAYLKAHYPAEYMSAVLTSVLADNEKATFYMEESRRMGIPILPPDVNESEMDFSVNKNGEIRFGLAAIKGMGEAASTAIIEERRANGAYKDIFNLMERVGARSLNRKNLEVLAKAGAFDGFENVHRAQYFVQDVDGGPIWLEKLMRWAARKQEASDSAQVSLFDISEDLQQESLPEIPKCTPWSNMERCMYEKESMGLYLAGHPLDDFKWEIETFVNFSLKNLNSPDYRRPYAGKDFRCAGIIKEARSFVSLKDGKNYASIVVEDYDGSCKFSLKGEDVMKFGEFVKNSEGTFVYLEGIICAYGGYNQDPEKPVETYIKLNRISLLSDLLEGKVSSLILYVPLKRVSRDFCDRLSKAVKDNLGKMSVSVLVEDPEQQLTLTLNSKELKVDPKPFLREVQKFAEVRDVRMVNR